MAGLQNLRPKAPQCKCIVGRRIFHLPSAGFTWKRKDRTKMVVGIGCRTVNTTAIPNILPNQRGVSFQGGNQALTGTLSQYLKRITDMFKEPQTPAQMVRDMDKIMTEQYAHLAQSLPWLSEEIYQARLQLLRMDKLEFHMHPVISSASFKTFQEHIMPRLGSLSGSDAVTLLWAYTCLGIHKDDPISTTLFTLCHKKVSELTAQDMATFYRILGVHPRAYLLYNRKLIKKVLELSSSDEGFDLGCSPSDLKDNLFTLTNAFPYLSSRKFSEILSGVHRLVTSKIDVQKLDPVAVCQLLRFGRRALFNHSSLVEKHLGKKIMIVYDTALEAVLQNVEQYSAFDIQVTCSYLMQKPKSNEKVLTVVTDRARRLMSESMRVADMVSLTSCLTMSTPEDFTEELCAMIKPHVSDLDIYSLSFIAQNMRFCIKDPELITSLHKRIVEVAAHVASFEKNFSSFQRLTHFLAKHPMKLNEADKVFRTITANTPASLFSRSYNLASMLEFLDLFTLSALPESVLEEIADLTSHNKKHKLKQLMATLRLVKKSGGRGLIVSAVEDELCAALEKAIEGEFTSVRHLYHITKGLIGTGVDIRNPETITKLFNHFSMNMDDLMDTDILRITNLLSNTHFLKPSLYDALLEHLSAIAAQSQPYSNLLIWGLQTYCTACANVNYKPAKFDEFLQKFILPHYDQMLERRLLLALFMMEALTELQVFPEKELKKLFNVHYLQQIDEYIADSKSRYTKNVQRAVANINRNISIEQPHLDVPWFSETYFMFRHYQRFESHRRKAGFMADVESSVQRIVGEGNYLHQHKSEYWHHIDFLVVLDWDRSPVSPDSTQFEDRRNTRVALLCLLPSCYCINVRRLRGKQAKRIHQLQTLGYQVVMIPHFEWYAMDNSKEYERDAYLKNKIFRGTRRDVHQLQF